jgi:hypothetical protein
MTWQKIWDWFLIIGSLIGISVWIALGIEIASRCP